MTSFVRKNLLTLSGQFFENSSGCICDFSSTSSTGPTGPVDPASVTAVLSYNNLAGLRASTIIQLSLETDGVTWTGNWDSSACQGGRVDWVVYSAGGSPTPIVSATEGSFQILANKANVI